MVTMDRERYLYLKREQSKRYRKKNAEKIKAYKESRKEKFAVYSKEYREKNSEELKRKKREYYYKNKEKLKKKIKQYQENNKEKSLQWKRDYLSRNPEVAKAAKRRRRAREANVPSERYTKEQVLELYGTDCYLCGAPIDLEATRQCGKPGWQHGLHLDHLIPISKGGSDTIDNIRPAHAVCNLSKGSGRLENE